MMAPEGGTLSLAEATAAGRAPWQGTPEQLVDHLGQMAALGLDEVVFEHFCHEEDTVPEWITTELKPLIEAL